MERWSFVFVCSVYLNILVNLVSGLTMHNCIGGWIDVPEDTSTFITCSNISKGENVTWTVENDIRNIVCGRNASCNGFNTNEISVQSYKDDGVSLVINRNHRRYGGFTVTCSTTTEHAHCRMHVIHAAELSQCKTEINPGLWTLTTTCLVNKLFSSKQNVFCGLTLVNSSLMINPRLPCQLYLQNYTDTVDNNTYQRGTCNFTGYLPPSAGNYSYMMQITPGTAQETVVEVWIDNLEPKCAKFSQEYPNSSCECFKRDPASVPTSAHSHKGAKANYVCNIVRGSTSHRGQPSLSTTSQTPRWNNTYYSWHSSPTGTTLSSTTSTTTGTTLSSTTSTTTGTTLSSTTSTTTGTTLSSTTSTTTRTTFSSTRSTTKTPQSSHVSSCGPQSVRISTNATQPLVTDGTAQMALFCQADDVNPAVNYTWAGVTCINEHHEHGTCIFTPRVPQDDGHRVLCTAYNVVSLEQRTSEPYTIQLNYPPPSPPSIRGYREGLVLTEGDNITVYCAVKGGKPKVLSVTFFCGDEPDKEDIVQDMLVWSPVIINVKTKHNNTVCECSAIWNPQPGFYSHSISIRLYVREKTTPRPLSKTTREMYTEQPTRRPVKTSQVTHVTTLLSQKGLGSSPSDQMDSSPSPQSEPGQSVTTWVIAGIVAAVVVTVIVIPAIVYVTRRQQNRSKTRNTSLKNNTQDTDFEEQINEFYISADALGLDRIRPVDDLPQSRVQDPVAQLSPYKSSNFTDKGCSVQKESYSSVFLPAHQTQTTQPCLKELERNRESTLSNTENFYAEVVD